MDSVFSLEGTELDKLQDSDFSGFVKRNGNILENNIVIHDQSDKVCNVVFTNATEIEAGDTWEIELKYKGTTIVSGSGTVLE